MVDAALVLAIVFAVNLLPTFGPPTCTVLVALSDERRAGLEAPRPS